MHVHSKCFEIALGLCRRAHIDQELVDINFHQIYRPDAITLASMFHFVCSDTYKSGIAGNDTV
jgi:hypothetical protein